MESARRDDCRPGGTLEHLPDVEQTTLPHCVVGHRAILHQLPRPLRRLMRERPAAETCNKDRIKKPGTFKIKINN